MLILEVMHILKIAKVPLEFSEGFTEL